MNHVYDVPVLIVGGGPVGLALALDLGLRGTRSVVVEQDEGTATVLLAKAGTLNERTMEFCRRWGIAEEVANVGFPADYPRDTVFCISLTGFFIGRDALPSTKERKPPEQAAEMLRKCPQHLFDPLLARAVVRTGLAEIRYSSRFDSFTRDKDGVTATLTDLKSGKSQSIRSQYLVACDGAASGIRSALGIAFDGKQLDYSVSAMIRVPTLEKYHDKGKCERFLFVGPQGTWANLTAVDGNELWRLTLVGSEDKLDPARLDIDGIIRQSFGRDDIPYQVLRVVPWRRSQCAAGKFSMGRVALAGDSAHTTSPTGGHGLNTGIGDVSDLGWMLDALVRGWGGPRLLEAYDLERRSVAIRNSLSSTKNYAVWVEKTGRDRVLEDTPEGEAQRRAIGAQMSASLKQEWFSLGIGMGYRYEGSPIIVPDGTPPTPDDPSDYVQTARPGHRAPHAWLQDGRSIIDLFGNGFVLLRFGLPVPDASEFVAAARSRDMPLFVHGIGDQKIAALYERRLVLVRPDGQVAWRADFAPKDAGAVLDTARGAGTR